MDKDRRQTIVMEIEKWRRSKLLPDQYCDFLLNLYMDPNKEEIQTQQPQTNTITNALVAIQKATGKQWLFTIGTFTLISFVVLYFSRFHPILQIGIIIGSVAVILWLGAKLRHRNEATGLSITSVGMVMLLGVSLYMLEEHGLDHISWKIAIFGICSLFWIIYGIVMRIPILHLSGWLIGLLVYGWLLSQYTINPTWYEVQLFWLPLSILFGWSCWFIHRWTKPVSAILFVACALTWLLPELYMLVIVNDVSWLQMQVQLIMKITIGGALLFSMRKKWMVWVA